MSLQINILDKVEYYPFIVDNKYWGRIDSNFKITWEINLFSNIDDEHSPEEVRYIEDNVLKQFKLINNE